VNSSNDLRPGNPAALIRSSAPEASRAGRPRGRGPRPGIPHGTSPRRGPDPRGGSRLPRFGVLSSRGRNCQAPGLLEDRLDPVHRCDGRGSAVQEFVFNLDGWSVADFAVEPAMVEPVDVFSRRDLQVVDAPPGSFVADQFGLEEGVERLNEGVVVAVGLGTDRGDGLGVGETVGVTNGSILTGYAR
jgi:hypothetical protein